MDTFNRNISNIFLIFILSHLLLTIVPSLTNQIYLDTQYWLGAVILIRFNKHPPMSAFFRSFFSNIWITRLGLLSIKSIFVCTAFYLYLKQHTKF